MVNVFEELLDVLQVVLAGVVRVEVCVKVGDGRLCVQLALVLGLSGGAVVILRFSDDLSDGVFS